MHVWVSSSALLLSLSGWKWIAFHSYCKGHSLQEHAHKTSHNFLVPWIQLACRCIPTELIAYLQIQNRSIDVFEQHIIGRLAGFWVLSTMWNVRSWKSISRIVIVAPSWQGAFLSCHYTSLVCACRNPIYRFFFDGGSNGTRACLIALDYYYSHPSLPLSPCSLCLLAIHALTHILQTDISIVTGTTTKKVDRINTRNIISSTSFQIPAAGGARISFLMLDYHENWDGRKIALPTASVAAGVYKIQAWKKS